MSCVYCLETNRLQDRQVLLGGENLYLCAPLGQLVEGFLVIAPFRCIGSLSKMPAGYFAELRKLKAVVADFYAKAYGRTRITFYEQGRAGGGTSRDGAGGFPLHAHLCCLPRGVNLHATLARDYVKRNVPCVGHLPEVVQSQPYVYVESMVEKSVYVATTREGRIELERKRLKPAIAALLGLPERGYWRTYPGDHELERLIQRWRDIWRGRRTRTANSSH